MWWECSECGGHVERAHPPAVCRDCGIAGALFVEAEHGLERDPELEGLRDVWLQAGLQRQVQPSAR